ncbi:unnamed protein product [Parnassius apollo]|uniref:(apollo) hypothetical protein n=1 Tax=Parnassius apollo TaxID=110799 RepID=A0A8S3WQU2_PARAO|nr:unnamed protein product [Parnassius apollo]
MFSDNCGVHGAYIVFVWMLGVVSSEPSPIATLQHVANISHGIGGTSLSEFGSSNFSPRMDFEQWKPLTGRGDPLRNDPTYDYEPPVLERVHYWADESRLERERYPERKSEVLMLGVSSRKPSVAPRTPQLPPKRQHRPPPPPPPPPHSPKYEDYTYRYSEYYPMTILVPPPPPPPGHQPSLFIMPEEKIPVPFSLPKQADVPIPFNRATTVTPEHLSSFAVQEANLIYQASTTSQNWFRDFNQTKVLQNSPITSDYAGWGPTTPLDDNNIVNDTHNLIFNDHTIEISEPYLFYKPFLSESPPPLITSGQPLVTAFVPTASPPVEPTTSSTEVTWPSNELSFDSTTEIQNTYETTTHSHETTNKFVTTTTLSPKSEQMVIDMLGPMMSMPLAADPERSEDNLYAHASENIQFFKEQTTEDIRKLELMQNIQPPPSTKFPKSSTEVERQPFHVNPHVLNNSLHAKKFVNTHDPYLHMRFTTPMTSTTQASSSQESKFSTEVPTVPMYLIIQGHSKVKTYSSKAENSVNDPSLNDLTKHKITSEVKHLHPLKEKHAKKLEKVDTTRKDRARDLKTLIDNGLGSIEIQEADIGIKYDVSDGSKVPIEVYKKGIVDNDENNYNSKEKRNKRQVEFDDLLPFNDDSTEKYVYVFSKGQNFKRAGITELTIQAVDNAMTAKINDFEGDDKDVDKHGNEDR